MCIWIVEDEKHPTLETMMKYLKKHNSCYDRVQVVVADNDLVDRYVLQKGFPESSLQICLFHTMRTFKREVSTQNMKISTTQQDASIN